MSRSKRPNGKRVRRPQTFPTVPVVSESVREKKGKKGETMDSMRAMMGGGGQSAPGGYAPLAGGDFDDVGRERLDVHAHRPHQHCSFVKHGRLVTPVPAFKKRGGRWVGKTTFYGLSKVPWGGAARVASATPSLRIPPPPPNFSPFTTSQNSPPLLPPPHTHHTHQ